MHYYKFNIADYRKDTGHLSTLEHGIYRQLIDWYYLDEQPIPAETQLVARRLRLGSEMDMHSLKMVLSDFFVLGKNGYVHKRIEVEIKDYHENAEKNKNNGKLGGRPKKTQSVISGNPNDSQNNPNQEPITINQEPSIEAKASPDLGKPKSVPSAPIQEIVEMYNKVLPELPEVVVVNESRKRAVSARWREVVTADKLDRQGGLDFFKWYFEMVKSSKFLTGRAKDWKADFDFLFNASKFPRIVEGTYHKEQK